MKKSLLVLSLVLSLTLGIASSAFATNTNGTDIISQDEIDRVLAIPAYTEFTLDWGNGVEDNDANNPQLPDFSQITYDQFGALITQKVEQNLLSDNIRWNPQFIEEVATAYCPQYVNELTQKTGEYEINGKIPGSPYTRGSRTVSRTAEGEDIFGNIAYDLKVTINFAWDGTYVTSCVPNTVPHAYAPTLVYDGLNSNINQKLDSGKHYYVEKEAHFYSTIGDVIQAGHYYPMVTVDLYGNGNYSTTANPGY